MGRLQACKSSCAYVCSTMCTLLGSTTATAQPIALWVARRKACTQLSHCYNIPHPLGNFLRAAAGICCGSVCVWLCDEAGWGQRRRRPVCRVIRPQAASGHLEGGHWDEAWRQGATVMIVGLLGSVRQCLWGRAGSCTRLKTWQCGAWVNCVLSTLHTDAYTTHANTCMHTPPTHTDPYTYTCGCIRLNVCHTCHAHTHRRARTTHTHTHTQTHTHTHTHTRTRTHAPARARTHARTHTHTCPRSCIHKPNLHTVHTPICSVLSLWTSWTWGTLRATRRYRQGSPLSSRSRCCLPDRCNHSSIVTPCEGSRATLIRFGGITGGCCILPNSYSHILGPALWPSGEMVHFAAQAPVLNHMVCLRPQA